MISCILARTLLSCPIGNVGFGEAALLTDFRSTQGSRTDGTLVIDLYYVAMWRSGCVAHIGGDRAARMPAPHLRNVVKCAGKVSEVNVVSSAVSQLGG